MSDLFQIDKKQSSELSEDKARALLLHKMATKKGLYRKNKEELIHIYNKGLPKTYKKCISPSDSKYIVILQYVNCLLSKLKLPPITTLTEFKDIKKTDLVSIPNSLEIVTTESNNFLKYFTKKELWFQYRKTRKAYHVTLLRTLLKKIGYNLISYQKTVKYKRTRHYSII